MSNYITTSNVGLVAQGFLGSIPCLYTMQVFFHCILQMQSHIGKEEDTRPIFKLHCHSKSNEAQRAGLGFRGSEWWAASLEPNSKSWKSTQKIDDEALKLPKKKKENIGKYRMVDISGGIIVSIPSNT